MKTVVAVLAVALTTAGSSLAVTTSRSAPSPAVAKSCASAIINARLTIITAGQAITVGGLDVTRLDAAVLAALHGDTATATTDAQAAQPGVKAFAKEVGYFGGVTSSRALTQFNRTAAACWSWASVAATR